MLKLHPRDIADLTFKFSAYTKESNHDQISLW